MLRDFFNVRMQYYDRRKASLADKLTEEWEKLDNKVCLLPHAIYIIVVQVTKYIFSLP